MTDKEWEIELQKNISKFDEWMSRYTTEFVDKYNKNCRVQDLQPGHTLNQIQINLNLDSWQNIATDDDVFHLKEPIAGMVKSVNLPAKILLKRIIIGYSAIKRVSSYEKFTELMHPLLTQTTLELENLWGFNENTKTTGTAFLTFQRPDETNKFWYVANDYAALEIRAHSCVVEDQVVIYK